MSNVKNASVEELLRVAAKVQEHTTNPLECECALAKLARGLPYTSPLLSAHFRMARLSELIPPLAARIQNDAQNLRSALVELERNIEAAEILAKIPGQLATPDTSPSEAAR